MRLFYQTLGMSRGSKTGTYGKVLQRLIANAAAPGTTIDVFGLAPHRAVADQYRYLEFQDTTEVLENGLRAEREGYDAILLGNIFQPGLHELRELLNIPVLGLSESAVQMACLMGPTFSLINVNPKFNRRVIEGIRLQGLEGRMTSVEMMTVERPGVFDIALSDPEVAARIVEQFTATARHALDKGAEVLIPAGGSLMAVLIESGLTHVDGAISMARLAPGTATADFFVVIGDLVSLDGLTAALAEKPDVVFNALNGVPGEDGSVQGLLDLMGLAYTHSGLATSVIAIDKQLTKQALVPHGIPMPGGRIVTREELYERDPLPRPYVLKPVNEGSSVGVAIVTADSNVGNPISPDARGPWQEFAELLAEPFIKGRELTDAVLDGPRSVVLREAHNRMAVQMAVLHRMLARRPAA